MNAGSAGSATAPLSRHLRAANLGAVREHIAQGICADVPFSLEGLYSRASTTPAWARTQGVCQCAKKGAAAPGADFMVLRG